MVKRTALFLLACSLAAAAQTPRKGINIPQRMMVLESNGSRLKINELYTVEYQPVSSRAKTAQVMMKIYLPDGATVEQATARPSGNASLKTAIVQQAEKNLYAFTYPIRPGTTQFAVTYTLPYQGQLKIAPRVTGPTAQLMLITPNSMSLTPDDDSVFTRANDPMLKNVTVLVASTVTPGQDLGFEVSGTGTLAHASQEKQAAPQGSQPAETGRRRDEPVPHGQESAAGQSRPWIFVAVVFLFLAAAASYVYSVNHAAPTTASSPAGDPLLAAMREEMFQLESDRLQGKLSPDQYEAAKAALDKALSRALEREAKS
ncbi:MAG TPA: hypothetical protein VKE93_12005 [Candidatus Angelobacter sp.]|nr:hypothetical protein [Candidatus Angelobacter sp.]